MLLCRHILLFFKKYIRIGKNSFISLAFLLLSKKSHLFEIYSYFHKIQTPFIFQRVLAYLFQKLLPNIMTCKYQKQNVICS